VLTNLRLRNFKTWSSADLSFGRITGLFGTNSSGKTSLVQFLLLLKQTKEATDRGIALDLNGPYVSLGSYEDVVHNHDVSLPLRWTLAFEREAPIVIHNPSSARSRRSAIASSANISVSGRVEARDKGPEARAIQYKVGDDHRFRLSPKRPGDSAFDLKADGSEFRFIRTPGRAWQLPGPIKSYAFPDQARTYFQNASFLAELEKAYEDQIDTIFYLGPLREYPKRIYSWARTRPRDVGVRGEFVIDAILSATAADEQRNLKHKGRRRSFQEMIAYWLTEMGMIEGFVIEELTEGSGYWRASVNVKKNGPKALLTDVGFGVSQVLPIITLLYYVPEGSTVILEQPEIHLHPLAQANLADVIINVALHRNVQVIFESHSEHLLLRLQRRIAEAAMPSRDVKLYFCESESGDSKLQPLQMDEFGQIQNWPLNFMGDAFGETLATERARLERLKD